jgi:hypothetical protein
MKKRSRKNAQINQPVNTMADSYQYKKSLELGWTEKAGSFWLD